MPEFRTSRRADLALRGIGLLLVMLGACAIMLLTRMVHSPPVHEARPSEILVGGIGFLGASAGLTLIVLGRHIFDPVTVSARWAEASRSSSTAPPRQ